MKIDVLMPVYATPLPWLKEAVQSILYQKHTDCSLIIVDDNNPWGPLTDYLYSIPRLYDGVVVVRKNENEGIAAALNFGLKFCSADLIVRMDADDIASPDLLTLHDDFFTRYEDRHICGIQIQLFNGINVWESHHFSEVNRSRARNLPGHWFVNHPGICYRRETIIKLGGYPNTPKHLAEDYALWIEFLLAGFIIYNRSECLLDYRVHSKSFSFAPDRKAPEWHEFLQHQKERLNE